MEKHIVGLTSTEIAGLWTTYLNDSMNVCISKYLLKTLQNDEIEPLLTTCLELSELHLEEIRNIFNEEKFPIPKGFTDEDINLSAPPLFFDLFPVSYVYGMSRMGLSNYGMITSTVAREDVRLFFSKCLNSNLNLYNRAVDLMLSKGIYDRPTMIPYPKSVEFIKKKELFLSKWLEIKRPLNVLEISDIFFNIERNYFALILLTAFIQVTKDKKIQQYYVKGKKLAQDQIQFFNNALIKDDLLGTIMVNNEVSTSTEAPFSEKLMLNLITMLNSSALTFMGHGLTSAQRIDLVAEYKNLIDEILSYGNDGFKILVDKEWLEEPPHAPNRKDLADL